MSSHSGLKEYREQLNLTQRELAKLAGVSQAHVSRVELGTKKPNKELQHFLDNSAALAKAAIGEGPRKK